jgi:hypothetical protein
VCVCESESESESERDYVWQAGVLCEVKVKAALFNFLI